MSLRLKLILIFAGVFTLVFGGVGFAAVRAAGEIVERSLEDRFAASLAAARANPIFFIHEASLREGDLRQVADISGIEVIVATSDGSSVSGSSLPRELASRLLQAVPSESRFDVEAGERSFRGRRAEVRDRLLVFLSPAGPIEEAKVAARMPILIGLGAALLGCIALGAMLAGTITRPLRRLAEKASLIREGRLDVPIPRGGGLEVDRLSTALSEMLDGLAHYRGELVRREKMATLGQFSAAVAHELRNPLSSMKMSLEMLRPQLPKSATEDLDFLLLEMSRLNHSVEELLFFTGTPRYHLAGMDARVAADGPLRMLTPLAEHLGVVLVDERGPDAVMVRGDLEKLAQAATNLILNALQACEEGGEVRVGVRAGAEIYVEDDGPGVPADIEKTMFQAFVSGRDGGTGLGLSVTMAIAVAHEGSLGYERRDGRSRFTLSLPEEEN
jgi:signal transduction histidine kinase